MHEIESCGPDPRPEAARVGRSAPGGDIWTNLEAAATDERLGYGLGPRIAVMWIVWPMSSDPSTVTVVVPPRLVWASQVSLEWTMCSNWRQRTTTRSAEPANANQNGAVIPKVLASRPPIGVPITSPPTIATR